MPTGPKHQRFVDAVDEDGEEFSYAEDCRCMLGEDHSADPDDPWGESLSVSDAADIWMSSGQDEDYTFGYSEDELGNAAGRG
jgi:hypothetical protein